MFTYSYEDTSSKLCGADIFCYILYMLVLKEINYKLNVLESISKANRYYTQLSFIYIKNFKCKVTVIYYIVFGACHGISQKRF